MTDFGYQPPVSSFLSRGPASKFGNWPNYVSLGFSREHVAELIRMATDKHLNSAGSDSAEVWAPMHAWRTLGQLRAAEAVEPLLALLADSDDDWLHEELPTVIGKIGPVAVEAAKRYLADEDCDEYTRATAAAGLVQVAREHPETCDECAAVITEELGRALRRNQALNGLLVCHLLDLEAKESLSVIETAFRRQQIDNTLVTWEHVKQEFGSNTSSELPAGRFDIFAPLAPQKSQDDKRKKKQKRKASAESRKLARRRK